MLDSMLRPTGVGLFPYIHILIPELLRMIEYDNSDLQASAKTVLSIYPNVLHPTSIIPKSLDILISALSVNLQHADLTSDAKQNLWRLKIEILPILQVFFFRHLHLIQPSALVKVMDMVTILLKDEQVEVRTLASVTLSGLIQCSQRSSVLSLKVDNFILLLNY